MAQEENIHSHLTITFDTELGDEATWCQRKARWYVKEHWIMVTDDGDGERTHHYPLSSMEAWHTELHWNDTDKPVQDDDE